jgi:Cu2+-exporting ATPase
LSKVERVAAMLSLKKGEWQAEMTPDDKARWVRGLNQDDTLFIGDGANDSLALEAAFCGGSPVTGRSFLEHKADFYFLGNSLRFVSTLLEVAHLRQRAVRRVFTFALAYNLGAVVASLGGWMSPLLAAVLMPLSSVATLMLARMTFGSRLRILNDDTRTSQKQEALPQGMQRTPFPASV